MKELISNSKIKKKRGPYKQYLYDKTKEMPFSTYFHHLSKENRVINNQFSSNDNSNENNLVTSYTESIHDVNATNNSSIENDARFENPNFIANSYNQLDNFNIIDNCDDEIVELNSIEKLHNHFEDDDDIFFYLKEALCSNISKKDLAAGYLAAFYSGRNTQKSLSDYLKLSNIASNIKLPVTFNGLKNLIMNDSNELYYKLRHFCGTCLKIIESPNNKIIRVYAASSSIS